MLQLEESFVDEQTFVEKFATGDAKDVVMLNVSGTMITTKQFTLCAVDDSALAQQFNIRLVLMPSERSQDAIDTLLNQFGSDVRKCICNPASSWHTFDGNALFATFGTKINFTSDGGIDGANMQLIVTYRVDEDDPTVRR